MLKLFIIFILQYNFTLSITISNNNLKSTDEQNLLNLIKLAKYQNITENVNENFYRLSDYDNDNNNNQISENILIKDILFGDENILNDFLIEFNIRFENQEERHIESILFELNENYNCNNNDNSCNKKNLIKIFATTYKVVFSINNLESEWEFEHFKIFDGEFHKIQILFSKGSPQLWFDCKLLKVSNERHDNEAIKKIQLRENTKSLNIQIITKRLSKGFDLNKMILFNAIKTSRINNCSDIPKVLTDKEFSFNVLDHMNFNDKKPVDNKEKSHENVIYELNSPIEKTFQSNLVFQPELIEQFTIETTLRFNNTFDSYFNIIKITDADDRNSFIRIFVTSTNVIFFKLNNFDKSTKVKFQTDHNKNIFDGNWHNLMVSFSNGIIKAWLDCQSLTALIVADPEVQKISTVRTNLAIKLIGNYEGILENLKFQFKKFIIHSAAPEKLRNDACENKSKI